MNESQLNDIPIPSIKKDRAKELDLNMVVNNLSCAEKNHRIAIYLLSRVNDILDKVILH